MNRYNKNKNMVDRHSDNAARLIAGGVIFVPPRQGNGNTPPKSHLSAGTTREGSGKLPTNRGGDWHGQP